jgi:hypothetical protein
MNIDYFPGRLEKAGREDILMPPVNNQALTTPAGFLNVFIRSLCIPHPITDI